VPENVSWLQLLFGTFALAFSLGVVLNRNPIVSALCLMGTLLSTAVLYLALGASFAGVVQIMVYAGAIAVLFVFIVMLLDLKESRVSLPGSTAKRALAALAAFLFLGVSGACIGTLLASDPGYSRDSQSHLAEALSARAVSFEMLSTHMLPFQITGILILSAVVGVVMLAKSVRHSLKEGEK